MKKFFALVVVSVCLCVFIQQAQAVVFTFEQSESCVYNAGQEFPYEFTYQLVYSGLDPSEAPITDFHLAWPTYYGGYIEVTSPNGWGLAPGGLYGPNYEANPGNEFTNANGSLGGFKIYGKLPTLVNGSAYLTQNGTQIGNTLQVDLPIPEPTTLALLALGGLALLRKRS